MELQKQLLTKSTNLKPPITWFEGILDYFDARLGPGSEDRRLIGHGVGRHVIGLYLIEMILKYALDKTAHPYGQTHDLHQLYVGLPDAGQKAAEGKYLQALADEVAETWDVARSIYSFLEYLGEDPIGNTRYFWEREHSPGRSIVFQPMTLRRVIYALFIALHNYPEGYEYEARYQTKFISLEGSFKERDERHQREGRSQNNSRQDRKIKPVIYWLEGLIAYLLVPCPWEQNDIRALRFRMGQRMVGLYLVEMILKYALDNSDRKFSRSHNLYALFRRLPKPSKLLTEREYANLMPKSASRNARVQGKLAQYLKGLGKDPITDLRYFWEGRSANISLAPRSLIPVVFALLTALHNYPPRPCQ